MAYDTEKLTKLMRFINKMELLWVSAYRSACLAVDGAEDSGIAYQRGPVFIYKPLYFIMGKKLKRCPKQCKKHHFLLKPVHYSAVFSRELSASFCPSSLRAPSITPKFNKDNHHFTISFILPADHKKLLGNEDYYRKEHERCREENAIEKSKLFIARPRSRTSFCSVCKADYDDYLEHINQLSHKRAIQTNRFNAYIEQLEEEVQQKYREEELRLQESRFNQYSEANGLFFTQQNTYFEEKFPIDSQHDFAGGFEYNRINEMLHSVKGFLTICNHNDEEAMLDGSEEQEEPLISAVSCEKKAEARGQTSRKPIIISGVLSHNLILH